MKKTHAARASLLTYNVVAISDGQTILLLLGAAVYATTRGDDIGAAARSVGAGTAGAVGAAKEFVSGAHLPIPYHPPSAYHAAYPLLTPLHNGLRLPERQAPRDVTDRQRGP